MRSKKARVRSQSGRLSTRRALILSTAVLAGTASVVRADKTWNGGGPTTDSGSWTTALNWIGGLAPTPNTGEILTFDGFAKITNIDNFAAGSGFGGLVFADTAGAFTLTGNQLKLQGDIDDNAPVETETISLPLLLDAIHNIDVTDGGFLTIGGAITDGGGSFGITKIGNGTLTLTGTNTFLGPVTIDAGILAINSANQLGAAPATATPGELIINGGTLRDTGNVTISINRGIFLGPAGGAGAGTFDVNTGSTLTYQGIIANNTGGGMGTLNKVSFGTLVLSGASTYSGATNIKNGTMVLNFADTAATTPTSNIINSNSALTFGGANAGLGDTSYSRLILTGKASTTDTQTFASTTLNVGPAVIQDTSGTSGTANLNLGMLTQTPGSVLTIGLPTAGSINTSTQNTNGILGGWATIGTVTANRNGVIQGSDLATVDANGNISAYTGYVNAPTVPTVLQGNVAASNNIQLNTTTPTEVRVAPDNADATVDINTFNFRGSVPGGTGSTNLVNTVTIGVGNTLRLGQYGTIFRADVNSDNNLVIGGTGGLQTSNSLVGEQDIGFLTAGGPDINGVNQPGEIIFNISASSETTGTTREAAVITDNGTAPVSVVKTGAGSMKFDAHNTFSGGLYILQGRLQFTGDELTPTNGDHAQYINPNAGGTGTITIMPGAQLFPSGAGNFFTPGTINNPINMAGNGMNADDTGAIRMGVNVTLAGTITLTGDARFGGGGGNIDIGSVTAAAANLGGSTGNNPGPFFSLPSVSAPVGTALGVTPADNVTGQITGPHLMSFGASGNAGGNGTNVWISNPNDNWTGDTQIEAREGGTSQTTLNLNADNVIPDGHGFGNVTFGSAGAGSLSTHTVNMNGHSDTINGLTTANDAHPGNAFIENDSFTAVVNSSGTYTFSAGPTSTLTVGNDDQTSTFGGIIQDANTSQVYLPNPAWAGSADGTLTDPDASGNQMTILVTNPAALAGSKMAITKTGAGVLTLTNTNTYTGDTNINSGTLNVDGALASTGNVKINTGGALSGTGSVGLAQLSSGGVISPGDRGLGSIGSITVNSLNTTGGGKFTLDLGTGTADTINVTNGATFSGSTTVTTFGVPTAGTYTILSSGSLNLVSSPTFSATPPPQIFGTRPASVSFVDPTTTPGQLKLVVTGGAKILTWTGSSNTTWDLVGQTNWVDDAGTDQFFNGDIVNLLDGAANENISLSGPVSPQTIEVNTNNDAYTIGGTGQIVGSTTFQKDGGASITIAAANAYTGTTTINSGTLIVTGTEANTGLVLVNGGTLQIGNGGTTGGIGTSSITLNSSLVYDRSDTGTFSNIINGGGQVYITGGGTVSFTGANTYTGDTTLTTGSKVIVTSSNSFGTISSGTVHIPAGAAIDLGGDTTGSINFGTKNFEIQGTGTDGSGAIINTGTTELNAFENISLDNDATIGGTARFDMRGGLPSLNLNDHTLTKLGNIQFSLVGASVSDGNIDVQAGTLSIEVAANIGSQTGTFTLENGTTLQFFAMDGTMNKPMQFNGTTTVITGGSLNSSVGGSMTFNGPLNFNVGTAGLVLNGTVAEQNGPQNLTKTGAGSLELNGPTATWSGTTTISAGTLQIGNNNTNGGLSTGAITDNAALAFSRSDSFAVPNAISGTGAVQQIGGGTITLSGTNTYTGGTSVSSGTLITNTNFSNGTLTITSGLAQIAQHANNGDPAGVTIVPALSITGGGLDITNNGLVIDYTAGNSPAAAVRQLIQNAYNGGNFNGNGIESSTAGSFNTAAGSTKRAIGYAEASAIGIVGSGTFMGHTVDDTSLLVRYTVPGDANLDGVVNAEDFASLAAHYGTQSTGVWSQGDFNYDGNVDTTDFNILAANFNSNLPLVAPAPPLGTLVPEPGAFSLAAIAVGIATKRRRRH